ncbi:MAG: SGNH/GDSL hydrolase family protein, partial [Armatimonadota bacterium]
MRVVVAVLIPLVLTLCSVALSAPGDQMLENPGFESGPWPQSPAWHGEMTVVNTPVLSGKSAGRLAAGPEGDAMAYTGYVPARAGLDYRFSVQVRGTGSVGLRSTQVRNHPDENYIIERPDNRIDLSDEWQEMVIDISPRDPLVTHIGIVVELEGGDAVAYLDDALLTSKGLPGARLTVDPGYVMLTPGEGCDLTVSVSSDDGPIVEGTLNTVFTLGDHVQAGEVPIAGETTTIHVAPPADVQPGEGTISIVNAAVGGGASAWVDVVDQETWAQFQTLAETAQIETPAHLLFLGDSLTDQRRGHNYTDMVSFWLDREHGDVTYRNAGVGGDYITRMWQRLQDEGAHRQEMYDDLFDPTPTRVFIWTGHNDSKLKSKPEYETP